MTSAIFKARLVLAGGCFCLCLAAGAAAADPAETPQPLAKAIVPVDQKTFSEGAAAFDAGNYTQAFAIFSKLAEDNDVAALRNVALMQRKGLGTAKDPKSALANFETAARAGLPTAAADLGEMLLEGEAGPPDPEQALPWLEMAAAANHPIAEFHLGEMYERGEAVRKDILKAELLYTAAAARGVREAAARLDALKAEPDTNPQSEPAKPAVQ